MLSLVGDLSRDGLTIVLTTHDLNWVASHLPRIVCLHRTVQADGAPLDVLRPGYVSPETDGLFNARFLVRWTVR